MSVRTLALALAVALSALAHAAANAADDPAQPSGASHMNSMPISCGTMMPRHDGADKGTPTPPTAMKCPMGSGAAEAAAATPQPNTKTKARAGAKRGHDHARTHKLM